jgi:hypothetical protein
MNRALKYSDHMMPKKRFLFDPRKLDEIRNNNLGKPIREAFSSILEELEKAYPGHICKKQKWLFSNAGGAMGQMTLVHASIREYIILFGTCIGTEGHSGRYSSEVFDFMIKGKMMCEYEGSFEPEVHIPEGPAAFLPSSIIKHYCIKDEAWMMEYARGNIIKMFPFGTADSIFSTLDIRTIGRLILHYGILTTRGLLTKGKDLTAIIKFCLALGLILGFMAYALPLLRRLI